jgi:hypothetical protein
LRLASGVARPAIQLQGLKIEVLNLSPFNSSTWNNQNKWDLTPFVLIGIVVALHYAPDSGIF